MIDREVWITFFLALAAQWAGFHPLAVGLLVFGMALQILVDQWGEG